MVRRFIVAKALEERGQGLVLAAFAMTSALHAHKAVASIFAWTETLPEEIDRLLEEIQEFASSDQSS